MVKCMVILRSLSNVIGYTVYFKLDLDSELHSTLYSRL